MRGVARRRMLAMAVAWSLTACLTGCGYGGSPSAVRSPAKASAAVAAELREVTGAWPGTIVDTGAELEAAVWNTSGTITFWRYTSAWSKVGTSTFPVPSQLPLEVTVVGTVLTGMQHATFVATGRFTTSGQPTYLAYTAGPSGWGRLQRRGSTLVPSVGTSVGASQPELAIDVAAGKLVVRSATTVPGSSNGRLFPVVRTWTWRSGGFALDSDNIMTAVPTPMSGPQSVPALPAQTPVPDGYWSGSVQDLAFLDADRLSLAVAPGQVGSPCAEGPGDCPSDSGPAQALTISTATPVTVPIQTDSGTLQVSAPAWLLTTEARRLTPAILAAHGSSPYFLPAKLGATGFAFGTPPQLAVRLTIKGGRVTGLDVLPTT